MRALSTHVSYDIAAAARWIKTWGLAGVTMGEIVTLRDGQEALCLFNEDKPFEAGNSLPRTSIKHRGSL